MIILILINLVIIVYIYLKYYKNLETIQDVTEEIKDMDSIIIGYINDSGFNNNFDLILAQIIELNIKGYITIEYNKDNINKYDYTIIQNIDIGSDKLSKSELLVLNFLFLYKTQITKSELENKLNNTFSSYNTQFNEIGQILNKQLIDENLIDKVKQSKLVKQTKKYIKVSIIVLLIITILSILRIIENSLLYMLLYILEILVSSIMISKASIYTNKGQILKYNIDRYRINLENQEFLTNKNTMQEIVLNKEFANSIALHINTQAKKAFVDDKIIKEATKVSKKTINIILIISVLITLIALILTTITAIIPKDAIFWIYLIIALIVAGVADVTLNKN